MLSILSLIFFGSFFFISLHFVFLQTILLVFKRSETDAYVISCRLVSATQATMAVIVGAIIASSCQDIMKDVHWLSNTYMYFGSTYFLYDTWAMYAYNIRLYSHHYHLLDTAGKIKRFINKNKLMVIHHLALPGVLFPLILMYRDDRGDFFLGVFYMIELVVPLLSAREILIQLKMKQTRLYTVTSVLVLAMFCVSRILVFPYLYHAYSLYSGIPFWAVPLAIPVKCNLSCLAILVPQIYWFSLMLRKLRKAIISHSQGKETDNENMCHTNGIKMK